MYKKSTERTDLSTIKIAVTARGNTYKHNLDRQNKTHGWVISRPSKLLEQYRATGRSVRYLSRKHVHRSLVPCCQKRKVAGANCTRRLPAAPVTFGLGNPRRFRRHMQASTLLCRQHQGLCSAAAAALPPPAGYARQLQNGCREQRSTHASAKAPRHQ